MSTIELYYERYWDSPEEYADPTTPQRLALLDPILAALPSGARALDVGCGRGEFCQHFSDRGIHAEGIDISSGAIAYARAHHPNATFHAGQVETLLPARAGEFDLVFSSEVIEHLFDVGAYLLAINHLLKDGGRFVLTTPYHGLVKNLVIDVANYARHYDPLGQHIRFFDKKNLDACLRTFGFRAVSWTGYGRPWPLWKSFFVVAEKVTQARPLAVGTQGRVA